MKKRILIFRYFIILLIIQIGSLAVYNTTIYAQCTVDAGSDVAICLGDNTQLNATVVGTGPFTYSWLPSTGLNNSSIPNPVANPVVTTLYTVTITGGSCLPSAVDQVWITVNPLPTSTATSPGAARCGSGSVTLTASGAISGENYRWYSSSTGGSLLYTGNPYTTPSISSTTTYFVTTFIITTGCENPSRTPVVATVNSLPTSTATSPGVTRCGPGSVTFIASGAVSGESYRWYSASTGGTPLGTGSTFTTPSISVTTTFYVTTYNTTTGCENPSRSPVVATVNPTVTPVLVAAGSTQAVTYNGLSYFIKCTPTFPANIVVANATPNQAIITSYHINWGDNHDTTLFSFNNNLIHSYQAGFYVLMITCTTNQNCIDTNSYNIFVGNNPSGGLGTPSNMSGCKPLAITFPINDTLNNIPGTIYTIYFGDGETTVYYHPNIPSSVTHTYTTSSCGHTFIAPNLTVYYNSFAASIEVKNPCYPSAGNTVYPIVISSQPTANFTVSNNTACIEQQVTITNTSDSGGVISGDQCASTPVKYWVISPSTGWYLVPPSLTGNNGGYPNDIDYWNDGTDILNIKFTSQGTYSITLHIGNGCGISSKTFSITINPTPNVDQPPNQLVCNGSLTTLVSFTGTGTSYTWTNNTTSIGLGASGTGNISPFTAVNAGSTTVVATITVTPQYTNGGVTCLGPSKTFTITVNPTPTVTQPASQVVCNGSPTALVTFTGTGSSYTWTNNTTSIGLGASGTGDILPFTAVNTGNSPVIATITVTPKLTTGGVTCSGPPKTFTITVNPTPTVTQPADQVVCNGSLTSLVSFTGTGTSYTWTNNTTSIGLGASGTGNISPFTAVNAGSTTVVATITVTPQYTNGGVTCLGPSKTFTITVNPTPTVTQPASQVVCNGSPTALVTFTGTGSSYTWTNNTTSIGLGASGTGDILPFTAVNTGNSPVIATITVTPKLTTGGVTCSGPPKTFTITVNPTPTVTQPADQVVCNGSLTSLVSFTGTGTSYTWTNNTTSIGLGASGTGNISPFTAVNAGSTTVVATITVTPQYTNGGVTCLGPSKTFTITVNPTPTVTQPASQVVCNGSSTALVTFTGTGSSYTWTNNTTSIGLGASGTGDILPFTAVNTGNSPVIATITVTPKLTTGGVTCSGPPKTFTITVNPTPTVTQPADQVVCNGSLTSLVSFTGTGTSYTWTNNTTSIGLGASGTGNISPFTAVNAGSTTVVATITVTPQYTNGGVTCLGPSKTFTITVNPTPTVTQPASQVVCNGSPTALVTFTGTGSSYTWTNNTTSIGLGASGTGDILPFTAVNTGNSPVIAIITVTPKFTNGGVTCSGSQKTFTITINPMPTVNAGTTQNICQGGSVALIGMVGGSATGGTWTSSIGGTFNPDPNTLNAIWAPPPAYFGSAVLTLTTTGMSPCSPVSANVTITVSPLPSISTQPIPTQDLCVGGALSAPLSVTFTGGTGTPSYQWYSNTTASTTGGTPIPGATSSTYTPPAYSSQGTYYYYVTVTLSGSGCGSVTSNLATVNVLADPTTSDPLNSQTLCQNSTPANLIVTPSGGVGTYSYQWYSNTVNNNSTGTIIPGATSNTYTPPTTTVGTKYYYCTITQTGPGCSVTSNTGTVIVNAGSTITTQPSPSTVCIGGTPTPLTVAYVNGAGTPSYQWYSNTVNNNTTGIPITGATAVTYLPPSSVAGTTYYYCIITFSSGGCASITSNTAQVVITDLPTITTQPISTQSICIGGGLIAPLSVIYTGGTGTVSYQWYSNTTASTTGGTPITGATSSTYLPPVYTIVGTYYYYVVVSLSGNGCGFVTSTLATVVVLADPFVSVQPLPTQTLCQNAVPTDLTVIATGGVGGYSFQWYSNTVNNNTTGTIIAGSTNSTFTPPTGTVGTKYYYCVITQTAPGCAVTSATATVIVNTAPTFSTQPSPSTVCIGGTPTPLTVAYVNGAGTPSYQWYSNTVNNNTTGIPITGATAVTYLPPSSVAGTTYYYCIITFSSGGCANITSNTAQVVITDLPTITTQPISTQSICIGGGLIAPLSVIYTGGTGTVSYQWYSNTTASTTGGTPITGATSSTYLPPVYTIVGTYYYYVVVSLSGNGCGFVTSTLATVVVLADPFVSVQPLPTQTLCQNAVPTDLTVIATGGVGGYSFQWYSNTVNNNTTGTIIAGSTNSTFTPPTGTVGTKYYYCVITQTAPGCAVTSATATVIVNTAPTFSTQPSPSTVCIGGTPTPLTVAYVNGAGTPSYQWYSNTVNNNTTGIPITGATAVTYLPPSSVAGTTYYYCIITFSSGGCASITSNTAQVVITDLPTITTQPISTQSICIGGGLIAPLSVIYTGGTGTVSYQWYSNTTASTTGGTPITGATSSTYLPPVYTIVGTYYYYVVVSLSGNGCGFVTSTLATVVVLADPFVSVQPLPTQTLCQNAVPTDLTVIATGGVGGYSFQWYSNTVNNNTTGTIIAGSTNSTFTPPTGTVGTKYYYCVITQTAPGCAVTSATATVIVNTAPTFSTQPSPSTVCIGGTPTPLTVAYVNGAGTPSYQWYSNTVNNNTTGIPITGATAVTYLPPSSVAGTTYYYCIITFSSGGCANITSNTAQVVITDLPTITTQPISTQSICIGGGLIAPLSVIYTGGTGTVSYQWYSNTTASTTGGTPITGATSSTYLPPVYTIVGTYYYYVVVSLSGNGCGIVTSTLATVVVLADPVVSVQPLPTQTLCQYATPEDLSVSATGGIGILSYQWYSNTINNNTSGSIIAGTNNNIYSPPTLIIGTMYYYCVITQTAPGCAVTSSTASIIVNNSPIITTQPISSSVCINGSPTLLLVAYVNGAGTPVYQWYSNTINSTAGGIPITGATNASFQPPAAIIGTTYYYCIISFTTGGCSNIVSTIAEVIITPLPIITLQPITTQNLCIGGALADPLSVTFTGGSGTVTYQWYSNTSASSTGGIPITGATTSSYLPPVYTIVGPYYYYVVVSLSGNGCGFVTSTPATVLVLSDPVVTIQPLPSQTLCQNAVPGDLTVTATGGLGIFSYQWYSNTNNNTTSGLPISGATNATYTPPTTIVGTVYYYCIINQTGLGCGITSATAAVVVNSAPTFSIQPSPSTVCIGGTPTLLTVAYVNGAGTPSYQWYSNTVNNVTTGIPIPGATSVNYQPPSLVVGTSFYYCIITLTSGGCASITSNTAQVEITELPTITTQPMGTQSLCVGGALTAPLFVSYTGGTGSASYQWYSNTTASITGGTQIPNATLFNYTPPTYTSAGLYYYYVIVSLSGNGCGNVTSSLATVEVLADPVITVQPLANQSLCQNDPAASLNTTAMGGVGILSYQWYSNTVNNNTTGTLIPGANTNSFLPPTVVVGTLYYYCVIIQSGVGCSDLTCAIATVQINPLPGVKIISGGGSYCSGGAGVPIAVQNTQNGIEYWLYRNDTLLGAVVPIIGDGTTRSFPNQTIGGNYTVKARNSITSCTQFMDGTAVVTVLPLPIQYAVTGGGVYTYGGIGVPIGLANSDLNIDYTLFHGTDSLATLSGLPGPLDFGNQTLAGYYKIRAKNTITGCLRYFPDSVQIIINYYPNFFHVYGGGPLCIGDTGKVIGLSGSEIGVRYILRKDGDSINQLLGTQDTLKYGTFNIAGVYTVKGINLLTGLASIMQDSAVITIYPLPLPFLLVPPGDTCPGTEVYVNGSQVHCRYYLLRNQDTVRTVWGTGATGLVSFGFLYQLGSYHGIVHDTLTGCWNDLVGTITIHEPPHAYFLSPPGIVCPGTHAILEKAQIGITYQLRRDNTINAGPPIIATDTLAIDFGPLYTPGIYRVIGTDSTTHCFTWMDGSVMIMPGPAPYVMMPHGDTCAGALIRLNGSQQGLYYRLIWNHASTPVDTVVGTGGPISFGIWYTSGVYYIVAIDSTTLCETVMIDSLRIFNSPQPYLVTPQGLGCAGMPVGVQNSQTGVLYQLIRDSLIFVGSPVPGIDGLSITFGPQPFPGIYTVVANFVSDSCHRFMSGKAILQPTPVQYIVNPPGPQCAGTDIFINGCQTGVRYQLRLNATIPIITKDGNDTIQLLHFGPQYLAGIYTVYAWFINNSCGIDMQGSTTINPLPLKFNITPPGANCEYSNVGLENSEMNVFYQLLKNGAPTGSPLPGTGFALDFGAQSAGLYSIVATYTLTTCSDTMNGVAIISPHPLVYAGNDTSICKGHAIQMNPAVSNYSSVHWETLGDGSFNNKNILKPIYTPGTNDQLIGNVNLVLTAYGTLECLFQPLNDTVNIVLDPQPMVNAGIDDTLCASQAYNLNGTAQYYTNVHWRTNGDGTFDNSNILNPIYTLGINDKTLGFVLLDLTAHGDLACIPDTATDQVKLIIDPFPIANAGLDDTICENQTYHLFGSALNYSTINWSTTGDGLFDDITIMNPWYTPGINDLTAGKVCLVMEASGSGKCNNEICQDTMKLTFHGLPVVNAGHDTTICANLSYTLEGSSMSYSSLNWVTTGDGTFINQTQLNPIYMPGTGDILNGSVIIVLKAYGTLYCQNEFSSDSMTLSIHNLPEVFPGSDTLVCSNSPVILDGHAINYNTAFWSSRGDGVFDDPSKLNAQYSPGNLDKLNGHVTLLLAVNGTQQCNSFVAQDSVTLTFYEIPTISASGDTTICAGQNAGITLVLSGIPPWNVIYFDGIKHDTLLNIIDNPFTYFVHPLSYTTYTITSFRDAHCYGTLQNTMVTVNVNPLPFEYAMLPVGLGRYCEGDSGINISIDSTQVGFHYQLYRGNMPDGQYKTGTGSAMSFGVKTIPGIYKVKATNPVTGCEVMFIDSLIIVVFPAPRVDFSSSSTCFGDSTNFKLSGLDIGKVITWDWSFGDGTYAHFNIPENPTHKYNYTGIYFTDLSIVDTNGCVKTIHHQTEVKDPPTSLFSHDPSPCTGTMTHFSDYSIPAGTDYINKWHWSFGDGSTTTIYWPANPDVDHIYLNSVNVTATLTVTSIGGCTSSKSFTFYVNPSPTSDFNYSTSCAGETVNFTDMTSLNGGGNILTWSWNFGDPASGNLNTSGLTNPCHIYSIPGSYNVSLITMTITGCSDTVAKVIVVNPGPLADFAANSACLGNLTYFTDQTIPNADSIFSWNWDFGDLSTHSNLQNPTHTYGIAGIYQVKLTVMNTNGCSHDTTIQVHVVPLPTASFLSNAPKCIGAPVIYTNTSMTGSGPIIEWKWDFGDGTDTTIYNPGNPYVSHIFIGTTLQHIVRLTVTTVDSCSSFIEKLITSVPTPIADFNYSANGCVGVNVAFTDQSDINGGGPVMTWSWYFDDPSSGTSNSSSFQNPHHVFTTPGTFNVRLIVTNTGTCQDTITKPVIINPLPSANFTADTVCFGNPTHFMYQIVPNSPPIIDWNWNFGDGANSQTAQNPSHIYMMPGNYTVTLTITNLNGCISSQTNTVLVIPNPISSFSISSGRCIGSVISFDDLSTPSFGYITKWTWNFGDGQTAIVEYPISPNVTHVYSQTGSYNVMLTVQTNDSCSATSTQTIPILPSPVANFSYPPIECENLGVQFTDNSQQNNGSNIQSWNWNFGDPVSGIYNFSTLQNPSHLFSVAGNFNVRLIVTNVDNCMDTIIKSVIIDSVPTASFNADTACSGSYTHFTNQSIPNAQFIVSYEWDFGDGSPHNFSPSPTHIYPVYGIFMVSLKVTNSNGCINTINKPVEVLPSPIAAFIHDNYECTGVPVGFFDQSTPVMGYIVKWKWEFGDGYDTTILFPNSQDVTHQYITAGIYTVTLTVQNSDSCTASISHEVEIYANPIADFNYPPERCEFVEVQFSDVSLENGGGTINSWNWNFGDPGSGINNISTFQNPVHVYNTKGTYNVTLIVSNTHNCLDTIIKPITINDAPFVNYSADTACNEGPTHFTDLSSTTSGTIISWLWNFGDGSTSNLQNPVHTYGLPGIYLVSLTVSNSVNCQHDTTHLVQVRQNPTAYFVSNDNCQGLTTAFDDQSTTSSGSIISWLWDFGDGNTSDLPDPVHVYSLPGMYPVVLTITNSFGCNSTFSKVQTIYKNPNSDFSFTSEYCPAGKVYFTDKTITYGANIQSWDWIFETGYHSGLSNPVHTFTLTDTTYNVRLIVNDLHGCTDTVIKPVYVVPGFDFTFNTSRRCSHQATEFYPVNPISGDSLRSLVWDFDDPNSGSQNSSYEYYPTHIFNESKTYNVTLTAINSNNCEKTIVRQIVIKDEAVATFTFLDMPHCDTALYFTPKVVENGTIVDTLEWNFGGKIVKQSQPFPDSTRFRFPGYGNYQVTLTALSNNGCNYTFADSIIIGCISAGFTVSDSVTCTRQTITFIDNSVTPGYIKSWMWIFGDGRDTTYTTYSPTITHVYQNQGTYTVTLIIQSKGSSIVMDTKVMTLEIKTAATAGFSTGAVCYKNETSFVNLSNDNGYSIVKYAWNFNDTASGSVNFSSLENPTHLFTASGNYNVSLIVKNSLGCSDTIVKPVKVRKLPKADFINPLPCTRRQIHFTDSSLPGDSILTKYFWDFGDPKNKRDTSSMQDFTYHYDSVGTYLIQHKVLDIYGCVDSVSRNIQVYLSPISAFSVTTDPNRIGRIILENRSFNANAYNWDFGDTTDIDTTENPVHIYSNPHRYTISLMVTNRWWCSDTSYYSLDVEVHGLYVPNAFIPDSQDPGMNRFQPVGKFLKSYHAMVFDQWGHLLWESSELLDGMPGGEGWRGTDMKTGKLMPVGVYVWKISATFIDNTIWEGSNNGKNETGTTGTVTLIR